MQYLEESEMHRVAFDRTACVGVSGTGTSWKITVNNCWSSCVDRTDSEKLELGAQTIKSYRFPLDYAHSDIQSFHTNAHCTSSLCLSLCELLLLWFPGNLLIIERDVANITEWRNRVDCQVFESRKS